jgi:hypothetical protein
VVYLGWEGKELDGTDGETDGSINGYKPLDEISCPLSEEEVRCPVKVTATFQSSEIFPYVQWQLPTT